MLFDTHCHLDYLLSGKGRPTPQGSEGAGTGESALADILKRAESAGISQILTIATTTSAWDEVLTATRIAKDTREHTREGGGGVEVLCSVGIHPHEAEKEGQGEQARATLEQQISQGGGLVAAIGESGLDYFYNHSPRAPQIASFEAHIDLAGRLGLPLVVHSRNAEEDTARCLKDGKERWGERLQGVMHCFTSGRGLMDEALDLGFYISISGIVTFRSAGDLREIARAVPDDRLLLETDAPYLAPEPRRGKSNEPSFLRHTAEFMADLRGASLEELAGQTTANARRLFTAFSPN